ncbi:MAG: DUF4124 domain-containing protein [Cellvibrio sp.]|uniref:DUF4124 domain-containing protein n=1 Tax=Cellvibrio sp. TaxID=1965322 RepID=UPI0027248BD1|nr:DUF4124 domain-containing protein [Cellvibrio sp.]
MKKYFFALMILISPISFAADIYKCIDKNGKQVYSDKKCPKSNAEKIEYKETSLDDQLKALTLGKSKITNISRKDDETFINYEFTTRDELTEFMRLSQKVSGKHVNLLKVVMPKDNDVGKAQVQITTKPGVLGADPKTKN